MFHPSPGASGSSVGSGQQSGGPLPGQGGHLAPLRSEGPLYGHALAAAGPRGATGGTTREGLETRFDVLLQVVWKVTGRKKNHRKIMVSYGF